MSTHSEVHGINLSYMDLNADPGKDFYRYANGNWLDTTEIPKEYPHWGAFLILRDQALEAVHNILQNAANNSSAIHGSNEQKIGDFYFAGMNEAQVEADGAKLLAPEFANIDRIRTYGQLAKVVAHLHLIGANVFFDFGADADFKDSSMNIAQAVQDGLGLPDRDYYLKTDANSMELRAKYVTHIQRMFALLGYRQLDAQYAAYDVINIETQLAIASMTNVDQRDPDKTYHKMSLTDWQDIMPTFPLKHYLAHTGCNKIAEVNVAQPEFFKAVNQVLAMTSFSHLKRYLRWHLISTLAPYLSSDFVNEQFDFFGKTLQGSKEIQPRYKRVVNAANSYLGEAIGEVYVRDNFPPASKARMLTLVENLKAALKDRLQNITWMSDATRQNALKKLNTFVAKIGYPDVWKDYSALLIDRRSYLGNVMRAREFAARKNLRKIDKPVDRTEWHMTPQTVNAYYNPLVNEIVFPAAILQPPFFDAFADDATNYGGIGVVIGHEMTHGYDDQGSKFDAQGNLNNWWTSQDAANFEERVALIQAQYDSYQITSGEHLNGQLVSGEAAADLGGLKLGYLALQMALIANIDVRSVKNSCGFTDEQIFFIAFGQIWAGKETPEYARMQVATDPHPPGKFRTNGTLANMPEFCQAFGLLDNCAMMLPPDKRCQLW